VIFHVRGRYVSEDDACVSVLDRGFLYGDSVYETLRAHCGRILFWAEHHARLRHSATALGIPLDPIDPDPLEILHELLRRNGLEDARMRIIVTRGVGAGYDFDGLTPTWVVTCERFEPPSEEVYSRGVDAVVVGVTRLAVASLNPEIKSSNLLNNIMARREAMAVGAEEGILLNPDGLVAEGAHSNLFWVTREGAVCTPDLSVGILPGITRMKMIELARAEGLDVREVRARRDELERADEIFLTSTSWEALSVARLGGRPVGTGRRGPLAERLRERLRELYGHEEETA
jgi:branched-chain amino acid aminotransferase